jgi:carbamoyltransferase
VAEQLSKGKIVAWYQGNGEIGPRALGNRSLLMDPRIINGKDVINKIKKRENYRPFGASVLEEYQDKFFDIKWHDDYMLYVSNVIVDQFPPITHIDGTCRIQTVKENNYYFRKLLLSFYDITGCPILLNTSFNMAGKPICSTIEEALNIFRNTDIDLLVIGNDVYEK